jgi:hypothetical protein
MRTLSTFFFMVVWGNALQAQLIPADTISPEWNRYRASVSYDVPNLLRSVTGRNVFGPLHLDGHYFLRRNLAVGLNADFARGRVTPAETYVFPDTTIVASYEGSLKTSQYLIEGTYYLRFSDAEGKFLRNWDIYATLGLGIGISKEHAKLQNAVEGAPAEVSGTEYYFARQVALGAAYTFQNKLGLFVETGLALSRLQFGVFYTF